MSLSFNGTSSKLVGTGLTVGITAYPFTLFGWIKPSGTQNRGQIFEVYQSSTPQPLGLQVDDQWGDGCGAWAQSGASWKDTSVIDSTNWQPIMAVFTNQSSRRIYYKTTSSGVAYTDDFPLNLSGFTEIHVGARNTSAQWYSGLLAHLAYWNTGLTGTDWTNLCGGANPQSIASANLVDYWDLLTHASTQTGLNGRVLTATNTSTNASNPSVSAPSSGSLTGAITLDDIVAAGTLIQAGIVTGNIVLDDIIAAGSLQMIPDSSLSGSITLADVLAAGTLSPQPGIITTPPLKNNAGGVLANVNNIVVNVYNRTTGALVARITGLSTNSLGVLTFNDIMIVPGVTYAFEPDLTAASLGRRLPELTAT